MWYSLLYFGRDEIFFLFIQLTRVPVNLHKRPWYIYRGTIEPYLFVQSVIVLFYDQEHAG